MLFHFLFRWNIRASTLAPASGLIHFPHNDPDQKIGKRYHVRV